MTIRALGHRGDGVAEVAGRRVHVPFALPGERVRIALDGERGGERGRVLDLIAPAPERIAAICPHFGRCGGCALQHLAPAAYARFTRDQIVATLRQRGFSDPPVREAIVVPPGTRRRATLSAVRGKDRVILGYAERASHALVDLRACPVLVPELAALLAPLRDLLADLLPLRGRARLHLTATDTGADLVFDVARPLDLAARERLAAFEAQKVARIAWDGEVVLARATPLVHFAGIAVALPPGAFLQASAAGEAALGELVMAGVGPAKRVIDLYAGCGTFSLPLARRARVHAVEGDAAALVALAAAVRHAPPGLRPVTTERRDLAKRPLAPAELDGAEAVVFDPPRIGAKAQAEALARASVPRVVAVSCNPASFARDARLLVGGGYRLIEVTPVDQFLWSPHIELVGVFERV